MKTYLCIWPDKSFSLIQCLSMRELFWILDEEDNPHASKAYLLPERFQITTCRDNPWKLYTTKKRRVKFPKITFPGP